MIFNTLARNTLLILFVPLTLWADVNLNKPIYDIKLESKQALNINHETLIKTLHAKVGKIAKPQDIEADIQALYQTGLFQAISAQTTLNKFNLTKLTYNVTPNPTIKKIVFLGNPGISETQLKQILKNKTNQPLNLVALKKDKEALSDFYKTKGYDFLEIETITYTEEGHLEFKITEGYIESIEFEGLNKIPEKILAREMISKPNTPFNSITLRRDREQLLLMGYFAEISAPEFKKGLKNNSVQIKFKVKEKKYNRIETGFEQETEKFVFFFKETKHHIIHYSDRISGKVQIGSIDQSINANNYQLKYYEPWIFNRYPLSMSLDGWAELSQSVSSDQENIAIKNVENIERKGGSLTLGLPLIRNKLIVFGKYKYEAIRPQAKTSPIIPYELESLSGIISYRTTDSLFNPKKGGYSKLDIEKGGQAFGIRFHGINFTRVKIDLAKFIQISPKVTLAAHSVFGSFYSLNENRATYETEQFVIGGANSIRGFNEQDFPFVGDQKFVENIELRIDATSKIQTILFFDTGQTIKKDGAFNTRLFNSGAGIGFRYFTPIGPLRLDIAKGLTTEAPEMYIHFGIGQLF